jgi:hypothetical protein
MSVERAGSVGRVGSSKPPCRPVARGLPEDVILYLEVPGVGRAPRFVERPREVHRQRPAERDPDGDPGMQRHVVAEPALDPAPGGLADPDPRGNDALRQGESEPACPDGLPEREGDGAREAGDLALKVGATVSGWHPGDDAGRCSTTAYPHPDAWHCYKRGTGDHNGPLPLRERPRTSPSCVDHR